MGITPYPAIDYSDRDYASIRQAMINGIPMRLPEWTSRSPQDFGIVLIELFATMGDILSYYGDRLANEAFLSTATQRASVLKLASLLNYRPRGTAAATVELEFTVDGTADMIIPAGTQVRTRSADGDTPVIFSTNKDVVVTPADDGLTRTITAAATQGVRVVREQIGVVAGVQDETFSLLQAPVVESSLVLELQEGDAAPRAWSFQDNLIDARPFDNVFTTDTDANGVVLVQFGDNINGRIPPRSAVLLASYRVGGGEAGNVEANTIVEMVAPLAGVQGVNNPVAATGGTDVESIESIRANAPRSLQAGGRALTLDDHAALAVQVPQVAKARAEASVYSNVTIYIAPFGAGQPDQRLLNDVVAYLAPRKLAGVDIVAATPTYVYIDFDIAIEVYETYSRAQAVSGVENAIREWLDFDLVSFGEHISVGRIYSIISTATGVHHATITQMVRRGGSGVSDLEMSPGEIPVVGSVTITATGGTADSGTAYGSIGAGGSGVDPSPPAAPTLDGGTLEGYVVEGDTVHVALSWTESSDATHYYVQSQYLAGDGSTVLATYTVGPTVTTEHFVFSLPVNETAVYLRFAAIAWNGENGPITGSNSANYAVPALP